MKRFNILIALTALLLIGCINSGGNSAKVNDLILISGISNHKLLLDGTEGLSSTFTFRANHDWKIIDYNGFSCEPSSGPKTIDDEVATITARPLQSNNTADTIRLSDLNFKLLNTRFVGISAYQLPQIRLPKGNKVYLDAMSGSSSSIVIVSSNENIELVVPEDITASLSKKSDRNEYTIFIATDSANTSAANKELGSIGFKIDGVMQESKIEVIQTSAIVLDRSEVILPSKSGGQNIFEVDSDFDVEASSNTEDFILTRNGNTFTVTAMRDNNGANMASLGMIEVSLKDVPDCKTAIEVKQRSGKAPQTIIVNFVGTALQYYFNNDINKMLDALNCDIQGDSQVVVVTTDSTNKATLYELRYDKILGKAVKEKVKELDLPTPYNSALFEKNLRTALEFAPAEKYALVIGSHGLAWVPKRPSQNYSRTLKRLGITDEQLWQRNKNAEMTRHIGDNGDTVEYDISEIAEAIEANNIKLEYILFDACFMGNVESVYELRNVTNYIVGSPCEVMGYGFPYASIMQYMFLNNGTSYDLDKVCSEYVNYYKSDAFTPSACVAVTTTAELEALAQKMKAVNDAGLKSDFSLDNVQYYEGQYPHSFYDLGDMVEQSCADADVASAFKKQLDKTVTSRYHTDRFYSAYGTNNQYYHDINYYSGITTSAYVEHYSTEWQQTAWYKATH
jgi:hypothetical protein